VENKARKTSFEIRNEDQSRRPDIKEKRTINRNVEWTYFPFASDIASSPQAEVPKPRASNQEKQHCHYEPFLHLPRLPGLERVSWFKGDIEQQFSEADVWPGLEILHKEVA
jgi:hypothetical protein